MLDSGSYTTTSIVETGWTYNGRNSSSMDKTEQTQQISCIRNSMTLHIILDMAEGLAELQL